MDKIKIIIVAHLFFLIIICGCKKDATPVEGSNEPTMEFATIKTMTIGSSGGTIETENVSFKIPAKSLSASTELKILETGNLKLTNGQVSYGYVLSGLPNGYNGAVGIKIKYKGVLTYDTFISVLHLADHPKLGVKVENAEYFDAKDSSGYIVGTRLYENYSGLNKSLKVAVETQEDIILAKSGLKREFSPNEPFFKVIYEPTNFSAAKVAVLIDALEKSYKVFNEIGFDLKSKGFKNYLKVEVCSSAEAYYGFYNRPFPFFFNNSYVFVNSSKMNTNETLIATATHELFHYVQDLYGVNSTGSTYWVEEALSSWSEELVQAESEKYIPEVFIGNIKRTFHGVEAGQTWIDPFESDVTNKKQFHGYGMSGFIKYMVKNSTRTDKRTFTLSMLKNLESKKSNLEAVKLALLTQDFTSLMHGYFDQMMRGEVYGKNNPKENLILQFGKDQSELKIFDIKAKTDTIKSFTTDIANLGATVFNIPLTRDFTDKEVIKLKFASKGNLSDHKYYIYKYVKNIYPQLIGSGQCSAGEVTIGNIKAISEEINPNVVANKERTIINVLITNVNETKDLFGSSSFTLDIRVRSENEKAVVTLGGSTLKLLPAAANTGTVTVQHLGNKIVFARKVGTITYTAEVGWLTPPSGNLDVTDGKLFMDQIFTFNFKQTTTSGTTSFAGCDIMINPVSGGYQDEQQNEKGIVFSSSVNVIEKSLPATQGISSATTTINMPVTMLLGNAWSQSNMDGEIVFTGAIRKFGPTGEGDNLGFSISYTYKD